MPDFEFCTNLTDDGDVCGNTKYCERCFAWLTTNIEIELSNDDDGESDATAGPRLPHQEEICVESSDDDVAPADTNLDTPADLRAVPAPSYEIWLDTLADTLADDGGSPPADADEPPATDSDDEDGLGLLSSDRGSPPADADEPPAKMQRTEEKEEPEAEPPGKKLRIIGKKAH